MSTASATRSTHSEVPPSSSQRGDKYSSVTAASPAVSRSELSVLSQHLSEIDFSGPPPSGHSVIGAFDKPAGYDVILTGPTTLRFTPYY